MRTHGFAKMGWAGLAACLAAGLTISAAAGSGVPKMQQGVDYPNAGVSMAMPQGFEAQMLSEPFDLARGVLSDNNKPSQAFTMSCYPIAEKVTAERFADDMIVELQKVLSITKFSVTRKVTMQVAGTEAQVRLMSFDFRGVPTVAAKVFFTREEKAAGAPEVKVRVCYVLTAESITEKQGSLMSVLGEVIKTIKLIPIQQPLAIKPKGGLPLRDYKMGYMFRVPAGWYSRLTPNGAEAGQTDYVLGGIPMPLVRVAAIGAAAGQTAEQAAGTIVNDIKSSAGQEGMDVKVVSQKPSKMGGLEARQVVLTQTAATRPALIKKDDEPSVVIAYRATGAVGGAGRPVRSYSMAIYCQAARTEAAETILEQVAGSFEMLDAATTSATGPTSAASSGGLPSSQGATTAPTTMGK